MSDKDLRSQLAGLFSDIVPKPETEKKDESLLEEAVFGRLKAELAEAKLIVPETPPAARAEPEQITEEIPLGAAEERIAPPTPITPARPASVPAAT